MNAKHAAAIAVLSTLSLSAAEAPKPKYAVVISANMEWKGVRAFYPQAQPLTSPWGEYFFQSIGGESVLFFHEGWGKVAAAGATQYVIDRFDPQVLVNLGTCGGFEGSVDRFDLVLADKTVVYDIKEAMGDSKEAIDDYTTKIDLAWLGASYPTKVRKTVLVSADQDLQRDRIENLKANYGAVAGDWESGAIAYTASRNRKRIVILRGVSDLVSPKAGEAYGNFALFEQRAQEVMTRLLKDLPAWIAFMNTRPATPK